MSRKPSDSAPPLPVLHLQAMYIYLWLQRGVRVSNLLLQVVYKWHSSWFIAWWAVTRFIVCTWANKQGHPGQRLELFSRALKHP